MKKLGFGLMRMPQLDPTDASKVDIEQVKRMVDLFMERGFTYFDTAIMYNNFASQRVAKQALVDRYPRDSFTLATKLHNGFFNSLEDRDTVFNQQLEQTGAGYFDYYLLHVHLRGVRGVGQRHAHQSKAQFFHVVSSVSMVVSVNALSCFFWNDITKACCALYFPIVQ